MRTHEAQIRGSKEPFKKQCGIRLEREEFTTPIRTSPALELWSPQLFAADQSRARSSRGYTATTADLNNFTPFFAASSSLNLRISTPSPLTAMASRHSLSLR